MKKLFATLLVSVACMGLVACGASGDNSGEKGAFPSETITLVCPFSAGGGTDVGARYMATALSEELGVNVVVENQTGSGGWVSWTDVITGDYSDGYTIGLINHNFVMGELDTENPRKYNLDNVQVLANQALDYNVMAIRADETRFTDLESFIAFAVENPVLVSAQATGITDGDATTAEWFNKEFGTQITIIPVDGASDSRGMFLAGDTDIFFASVSDVQKSYQDGDMNILTIFSEDRSEFMPDVPTVKESTGKDFIAFAARGYYYPVGVPAETVELMTNALLKSMENETYINDMATLGLKLDNTSGEEFKTLLNSQVETRKAIWG